MTRKMTPRRICILLLAAFLALILIFRYISQQIYLRSLIAVDTVYESKQILRNSYDVKAMVVYDTQILRAPSSLTVASVQKHVGEEIRYGDALLSYDLSDLQIACLSVMRDTEQYEQQAAQVMIYSTKYLLFKQQAEKSRNIAATLETLINNNGVVHSTVNGYIGAIYVVQGDHVAQNAPILSVCDQGGQTTIQFPSPNLSYDFTSISVEFPTEDGIGERQKIPITQKYYDASGQTLLYSAKLSGNMSKSVYPGQTLEGTLQTRSKEYEHTLPIACLHEDDTGRQYVYVVLEKDTVHGKVMYVQQRTVYVLEKDAVNFSYTTIITEPVVVSDGKYLTDLCEVKLITG